MYVTNHQQLANRDQYVSHWLLTHYSLTSSLLSLQALLRISGTRFNITKEQDLMGYIKILLPFGMPAKMATEDGLRKIQAPEVGDCFYVELFLRLMVLTRLLHRG